MPCSSRRSHWWRVLLYQAALGLRAFVDVAERDIGVDAERLIAVELPASSPPVDETDATGLLARLRGTPGVKSVVPGEIPILAASTLVSTLEHAPRSAKDLDRTTELAVEASPGYLEVLGIPVIWRSSCSPGRGWVFLSATVARTMGGDRQGGCRSVYVNGLAREVAGIVADVWGGGSEATGPSRYIYLPPRLPQRSIVVRTAGSAALAAAAVAAAVREATGVSGPVGITLGSDLAGRLTAPARSRLLLLLALGVTALILAAVGVWSVCDEAVRLGAYSDAIRSAMGAAPSAVFRRRFAEPAVIVTLGLSVGLPLGLLLGRFITGMTGAARHVDLPAAAGVAAVVYGIGAAAALGPARRAASSDPLRVLRHDQ